MANGLEQFDLTRPDSAADSTGGHSVTGDTTADKDYDVINSYNFVLRVEGFQNIPLKAVRGINKQNEYEYIQEGGLNDYVHMVRKPISQPFTFQVERYVSQDWLQDAIDPLANGTELILPLILYIYRSNNHDGKIPARYYIFTNCRVTGVQVGDLDAEKSGLHTITNTIAYAQMVIVTMPIAKFTTDKEIYKFNNNNSENTTNTSHVRTLADMGITKMAELDEKKDKKPGETEEEFNKRNASLNYRGNRSKANMKALTEKYIFNSDGAGNTKNQDRLGLEKYTRQTESVIRQYEFTKNGTGPNHENTSSVAAPEVSPSSKKDMELKAEENRYKFSLDGVNANNENSANIASPEKTPLTKSAMESKAKKKKYKFKKNNKPNAQVVNAAQPDNRQGGKEEMAMKAKKYNYKNGRNGSAVKDELETKKAAMQAKAEQYNKQPHYVAQENEAAEIRNDYQFGDGPSANVKTQENKAAEIRNSFEYGDKVPTNAASQKNKTATARKYKYNSPPSKNVQVPANQLSKSQMEGRAKKYPKTRSARKVTEFLKKR